MYNFALPRHRHYRFAQFFTLILTTHRWQYDPGDNRLATKQDTQGRIPSKYNHLNQLRTKGSGPTRIAGTIDEPGTVIINGIDANMRNQTEFETYLDLPPGTHQIDIAATDHSENTATQSYEITIANEPEEHFEYDLNGNLVERTGPNGTTTYHWDAFDRLIAIHHPDDTSSHFTYDGLSRRVAITEKDDQNNITQDRKFLWHGLTIAEERSGTTGATVEKRFFHNGVELVTGPNAGLYTYRTDHLGSIREIIDSTGALIGRYDYDTWGVPEIISGTFELDFQYTGHFHHPVSGLHLAPFRAYDPTLARWLNRDPIMEAGGLNFYAYVLNDPINGWDPYGLEFWSWSGTAGRWAENAAQFSMGMADNLSFGLNAKAREAIYGNDYSDPCSKWYKGGEWTGTAVAMSTGVAGGIRAAGSQASMKAANKAAGRTVQEFSHAIPQRMGGPRSIWNGNYTSVRNHALSDPYRYRFMPRSWKADNPMPNTAMQLWKRTPNTWKGTAGGVAWGTGGKITNNRERQCD